MNHEQLEQALGAKPKTRGLRLQAKTEAREAVDLNIPFELNSAELKPEAVFQLTQLETALRSPSLENFRFMVAGHTDASGNATYNRQLSLRRAEAVKRYLVAAGVAAGRLECMGYGKDHLLTPDKPDDPINRRVEIRNLDAQ